TTEPDTQSSAIRREDTGESKHPVPHSVGIGKSAGKASQDARRRLCAQSLRGQIYPQSEQKEKGRQDETEIYSPEPSFRLNWRKKEAVDREKADKPKMGRQVLDLAQDRPAQP